MQKTFSELFKHFVPDTVTYSTKTRRKNKNLYGMLYYRMNMFVNVLQCLICFWLFHTVLPKPQVSYKTTSPGVIEANCTSVSRPPVEIVWNVERDNRTMGPPVTSQLPQGDGTTLVISTLTVQSGLLKDVSVKCLVHHKGLESPIAVSMNTKSEFVGKWNLFWWYLSLLKMFWNKVAC